MKKVYLKDESFDPIYKEVSKTFYAKTRVLPITLVTSGVLVLITQVVAPVLIFTTQDNPAHIVENSTLVGRATGFGDFEFAELAVENEYIPRKNADSKILGIEEKAEKEDDFFYITIPKLKIENAMVEINAKSLDPSNALGHYPGTELPGEVGNSFVFGHSVLPWFYNPKNYKTIFSTLDSLETGDEFYVTLNNREMKYVVEFKEELKPDLVNPLAEFKPRYLNESTMTLMTCSPAGTKLRRLMVNAVLIS